MESSQYLLSQLNNDYLTCHVCMEIYTSPKVLSCQHSFCKTCLESCEKSKQGVYIICPLCRQQTLLGFKGVQGLKNNFILSNMIDMLEDWRKSREVRQNDDVIDDQSYKMCHSCPEAEVTMATYQCIDCLDHLCADCAAFHTRTKLTKDHEVVSMQEIENGKYRQKIHFQEMSRCKAHSLTRLDHHCKECDQLVCRDCVIESHQGHHLTKATTAVDTIKQEINEMQDEIESEVQTSQIMLDELLLMEENEKSKQEEIEREVKDAAQYFINRIKEKRDMYLEDISDNFVPKVEHCKTTSAKLKQHVADYNNLTKISQCVLQDDIPFELLDLRKKMSHHLEESKGSFKSLQENHSKLDQPLLRFTFGEITDSVLQAMGILESTNTKTEDETPESEPEIEEQQVKSIEEVPQSPPTNSTETEQPVAESLYANFQNNMEQFAREDILIKPRPKITRKPSHTRTPVPVPRQRSQSVAAPATLPRPVKRPKPVVTVKPNLSKLPDCYRLTRLKGTIPLPEETTKLGSNEYIPRMVVHPVPQRAAPEPPQIQTNKLKSPQKQPGSPVPTHRRSQSHDAVLRSKSPRRKSAAPPPPVMLKAMLNGIIGVKREFQGPPTDVAFVDGNIVVLDGEGRQLVVFNKDRKYLRTAKLSDIKADKVPPLAVVAFEKKYMFILYQTFIGRFTSDGVIMNTFGHGDLIKACSLATNSQGHVVVLDRGKCDIFVFDSDGTKLIKFGGSGDSGGSLEDPRFLCITNTDDILVSDHEDNHIKCYERNGKFKFSFGEKGSKAGQLMHPAGIATITVNSVEVVLVADEDNNRISMFGKRGQFISNLVSNEPRLQSPQNLRVWQNKLVSTQRNCFQCPVYNLQ